MWYSKIITIFKFKELRNKILFVLAMMLVFRFAANIPIPGFDREKFISFFQGNQIFGLMNIFSGGALENFSIVMLGVGPYITATIIMQLLTLVFPGLEEMHKEEGEIGRRKFNQYARILTVPLASLQGFGMLKLFQNQGVITSLGLFDLASAIICITGGAVFLMWLGELITEKGIGNGISLLIFAGIISGTPVSIRQFILTADPTRIPVYILFFLMALFIIGGVVFINEARRNIPVSYAKRVRGHRIYGGVQTYLPMMLNPAGVIPIIFAMALLMFPMIGASFFTNTPIPYLAKGAAILKNFFENPWIYGLFFFLLIVIFTYFYTAITFNPKNIAENLQKMGGFIPGLRPGNQTADYIHFILNRVLLLGAIFLGMIAVMPSVIQGFTGVQVFQFIVGGASLLIIVSVVLETSKQIQSQLEMRE